VRSIRRVLIVAATTVVLALAVITPSVSADSAKAFHLTKTCESDVLCTIVSSDFKGFTVGTDVTYVNSDPWNGLAYPTIAIGNGSTTGVCDWNQPVGPVLAKCTFGTGTGRLTQFHLAVDVTFDGTTWFWDGQYWFGG
jgi:hypothetical protein